MQTTIGDIATSVKMVLAGKMDGRIVNISDEAPTSICRLLRLAGAAPEPSSEPLQNPWYLHTTDSSLTRSPVFRPEVRTVYQGVSNGQL